MVHHLALINKLRGNKFTYNRAIQRVRKVISLLLTMFLAHSLDLILILQYSEYLILPFCLFVCCFFFAAEHQPAADHILERFEIFGSWFNQSVTSALCSQRFVKASA